MFSQLAESILIALHRPGRCVGLVQTEVLHIDNGRVGSEDGAGLGADPG